MGKTLLESGKGVLTQKGMLFINEQNPYCEIYDGEVFPPHKYNTKLVGVTIAYGGRTEIIFLPDIPIAIDKTLKRLGATSIDDCTVDLYDTHLQHKLWLNKLSEIFWKEGLYSVNHVLNQMRSIKFYRELDKLWAAKEYAEIEDSKSIARLAKNITYFH